MYENIHFPSLLPAITFIFLKIHTSLLSQKRMALEPFSLRSLITGEAWTLATCLLVFIGCSCSSWLKCPRDFVLPSSGPSHRGRSLWHTPAFLPLHRGSSLSSPLQAPPSLRPTALWDGISPPVLFWSQWPPCSAQLPMRCLQETGG